MFTELQITNFQSLSNTTLKLGKITVIIGPSFLGKSAVVRAIYTLCRNRFEASFMKKGASSTTVLLKEDEKFTRYSRGNSSSYIFSGNPEPYTKIGRDVPGDIANFLQMDEIVFDSDLMLDFNFQRQFDGPFILSLSGFEIAKVFGKLMNLDIVLTASREISRDIQALNKKKDECTAIQDVSVKYIQEHKSIELKYALLQEALAEEEEADVLDAQAEQLLNLISCIKENEEKQKKYKELLDFLVKEGLDDMVAPPEGLEDILAMAEVAIRKVEVYSTILKEEPAEFDFEGVSSLGDLIVKSKQLNASYSSYVRTMKDINTIDFDYVKTLDAMADLISRGQTVNSNFVSYKQSMVSTQGQIDAKKAEFNAYIQVNNICPLTKLPMSAVCIQHIVEGT